MPSRAGLHPSRTGNTKVLTSDLVEPIFRKWFAGPMVRWVNCIHPEYGAGRGPGEAEEPVGMERLMKVMEGIVEDLYGHVHRVSRFATAIGRAMNLEEDDLDRLATVGVLHDVGKIHIDPQILSKPGPLVDDEMLRMRKHSEYGFAMTVERFDRHVAEAILYHHERFDGRGYPFGLEGMEIPLLARIVLVADAFDAITSTRSYQPALPVDYALNEIKTYSGTQFDPDIADAFVRLVESGALGLEPQRVPELH